MVVDIMTGKTRKPPKTYCKEEIQDLFNRHKAWLFDGNYVMEMTCIELFGDDVLSWIDRIKNFMEYDSNNNYVKKVVVQGAGEFGTFRAVNIAGFFDVVSFYNCKVIEEYQNQCSSGITAKSYMDAEQAKIAAEMAERLNKEEEVKRKRHEYYLKQKAKKQVAEG